MIRIKECSFVLVLFILMFSCNKPEDALVVKNITTADGDYKGGVYIVNEGNFDWGHGSLYHYKNEEIGEKASQEVFFQKNKFELGNVVQSLTLYGNKGYVVVNNSEKIEVADRNTMRWIGRIDMPKSSPRHILPINNKKAYVTELYAGGFWVVDLEKEEVVKKINASGWTENMVLLDKYVYMTKTRTVLDTKTDGQMLLKINTSNDAIVDSVKLPFGPIDVKLDKNKKLWVLCNGGLIEKEPALVKIDPKTMRIIKQFNFENMSAISPSNLRINAEGDELYFCNGGVYKMNIYSDEIPKKEFISKGNYLWYGMDVSPDGDIWVSDAIDYVQRGWAFRFTSNGEKLDSIRVGVIPNSFVFNNL